MSCWIRLGIEPTQDLNTIRQAYRGQLPSHHPETDPEGFQALRAAFEQAQRLAREHAEQAPAEVETPAADDAPSPALAAFHHLLQEPTLRYDVGAWQAYIEQLDELPLEQLEDLSWQLLHDLRNCGPLSNACASLLARRLGWATQLLRMEDAQDVEQFLQRLEEPDPFDTRLMRDWSPAAQLEALWYFRSLNYFHHEHPLFEYEQFAARDTCTAFPDDPALVQRLLEQFSLAGLGSRTLHAHAQALHQQDPKDVDRLYLLARQADALGAEEQALQCWLRLHREHQHPLAEHWLLGLCARHQLQRLPLLIQALDRQHSPATWPDDLSDPAQAWGSPAQSAQTLARWAQAARLEPGGIAATFIDWRLDGDDELPLLAWLLQDPHDSALQRRYWHAWALQRGEAGLLREILAEPPVDDPLDGLILEGFQRQAQQQLHWLEHAPVVQALVAYCASAEAQWPDALTEPAIYPVCREWLRRMRVYSAPAIRGLNQQYDMRRMFTVPFAVRVQGHMAERGLLLPPMPEGEALWAWHRQQLFMLAMAEQPERWLELTRPMLATLADYPAEHPFAALRHLLRAHHDDPEQTNALLNWLDDDDPLQALLAERLCTLAYAFNATRLPSAARLLQCVMNGEDDVLDAHPLGHLLLCALLYHDPDLDNQQRARVRGRLDVVTQAHLRFGPLAEALIAGHVSKGVRGLLKQEPGVDQKLLGEVLSAFNLLVRERNTPATSSLLRLQEAKDDGDQDTGLRCASMAVLAWSERLLLARSTRPAAPSWAFWRLDSRLGRGDLAAHFMVFMLLGLVVTTVSETPVLWVGTVLLMLSALLRRLHDFGHGLLGLFGLLGLSGMLPFAPLALLFIPGDKLSNRYGPPSTEPQQLQQGLQAALRRLIHQ